jgi:hypothetical protein
LEHATARLDWGRFVADCPNPACANAMGVEPGQELFRCEFPAGTPQAPRIDGCRTVAPIDWPADPEAIWRAVADLPESQQQWRPEPDEGDAA